MKTKNEYNEIILVFQQLHKKYPSYGIGRHVSMAFDEYPDVWSLSNKEFLFALNKYAAQLEMDYIPDEDAFLKKVIEDGNHLFDVEDSQNDEEEEEY